MITVCPNCKHRYRVADEAAGHSVECAQCQNSFVISTPAAERDSTPQSIDVDVPEESGGDYAADNQAVDDKTPVLPHARKDDKTPVLPDTRMAKPTEETPVSDDLWQPGEVVLGLYDVISLVGEGGMGTVHRVHHRGWNLDLAVKSPRAEAMAKEQARELIVREAEAWVDLGLHPNVASCFYVREVDGLPRIFIEYVEGGSMRDWMNEGKIDELEKVIDFAIQICDGMTHAHSKGMIHRDLKPPNCLMTQEGTVKITDFGLVKVIGEETEELVAADGLPIPTGDHSVTTVGGLQGTPGYIPPEQWSAMLGEGPAQISFQSDIYSFGVQLFEMLCGRRPYDDGTTPIEELSRHHVQSPIPDPSEFRGDSSEPLKNILDRAMAKKPDERFASFQEFRDELVGVYTEVAGKEYPRKAPSAARLVADALNNRAISFFDLGRKDECIQVLDEALQADPNHLETNYNRSLLDWRAGRATDEEIVNRFHEIVNSQAQSWRASYLMGLIQLERRHAVEADKVLAEACKHPDVQAEAKMKWGEALIGCSQYGKALHVFKDTIANHPYPGEVKNRAAVALHLAGEDKKAETVLGGRLTQEVKSLAFHGGGTCRNLEGHTGPIGSVATNENGSVGASTGLERDPTLRFWNLQSGECYMDVKLDDISFTCVALSPSGRYALSGSTDQQLRYWDLKAKKCIWTFDRQRGAISFIAFNQQQERGISVSQDGIYNLWDLANGASIRTTRLGNHNVNQLAFSEILDRAISTNGSTWFKWNTETESVTPMPPNDSKITAITMSGSGRHALLTGPDFSIQLWDLDQEERLGELRGHRGEVLSLAFLSNDTACISVSRDNTLRLWRLDTGQCILTIPSFAGNFAPIAISNNGRYCLWGGWDKILRLFDLGTAWPPAPLVPARIVSSEDALDQQNLADTLKQEAVSHLKKLRWKEAADTIRKAREVPGQHRDPELIRLWTEAGRGGRSVALKDGWRLRTLKHPAIVSAVQFSHDSARALTGDVQGNIRLWNIGSGLEEGRLEGHDSIVNSIAVSIDGKLIISGSGMGRGGDTSARLWEAEERKQKEKFECMQGVSSVGFSPDGHLAVIASREVLREAAIRVFNLKSGVYVREFEPPEPITSVQFHPNGQIILASSEDASLSLWDIASGRCLQEIQAHDELITSAQFSRSGRAILSSSLDGHVKFWNAANLKLVRALECPDAVVSAAFSPDGRFAITGTMDNTLQLWDVKSGQRLRVFEGHTSEIKSVAFSPNGRFALSASADSTAILWELDWDYEFPSIDTPATEVVPIIQNFLSLCCPMDEENLSKTGQPEWNQENFNRLLQKLQQCGLGWLHPGSIKQAAEKMIQSWKK